MDYLTLEQQLAIRIFQDNVKMLDGDQKGQLLVIMYLEMLKQQNSYKELIKKSWGL